MGCCVNREYETDRNDLQNLLKLCSMEYSAKTTHKLLFFCKFTLILN